MNVAIYELDHLELVYPWAQIFGDEKNNVTFIVHEDMKKDIQESLGTHYHHFTWIYKSSEQTYVRFIGALQTKLNGVFDLFLVSTVSYRHYDLSRFLESRDIKRLAVNVHSINNLFFSSWSFHLRRTIRHLGKKRLVNKADVFIVSTDAMRQYMHEQGLSDKPIMVIPPVVYEPCVETAENLLTLTVPGSIDGRRRDYRIVLNAYSRICKQYPIKLILAGKPVGIYGRDIINECRRITSDGGKIIFFDDEIPELVYRKILCETSIIISPVQHVMEGRDGIKETYGATKNSGNVQDAIRHGKPIILPQHFKLPYGIESGVVTYTTETDLITTLVKVISDEAVIRELKKNAAANSMNFTIEKMRKKVSGLFADRSDAKYA